VIARLIDQLGDDDDKVVQPAQQKLLALGEEAAEPLRRAARTHEDADARIRSALLLSALEASLFKKRLFVGHTEGVTNFAVSPDGKRFVSGGWDRGSEHVARVWDTLQGKELFQLKGHEGGVLGLDWSKDGKHVLTGSADRTVRLWDAKTGKQLKKLTGHTGYVYWVVFTPDGKKAVSCGAEQHIRVWDLEKGEQIASNANHADNVGGVRGLAMTSDGKHVFSAGFDGAVRQIAVNTCEQIRKFDGHRGGAWFVAVSPDGKTVASCGSDHVARLWDVQSGKHLATFTGHTGGVHGIDFSPDGKRLVTCGYDSTVRVWDVESAKETKRLRWHKAAVMRAAFLSDSEVLTASYDKTLRRWALSRD
jgi:WD40 repeat protein